MFYTTESLSERRHRTPEGFLLCTGAALARTGIRKYAAHETPIPASADGLTTIYRDAEKVFRPETLASATGKPVTNDHPPEDGTPSNWRKLAVGTVIKVYRGEGEDADLMMGDILVTDEDAIRDIEDGKPELSCGYDADYEFLGPGMGRQRDIIINHVALVNEGRCGPRCAIGDTANPSKRAEDMERGTLLRNPRGAAGIGEKEGEQFHIHIHRNASALKSGVDVHDEEHEEEEQEGEHKNEHESRDRRHKDRRAKDKRAKDRHGCGRDEEEREDEEGAEEEETHDSGEMHEHFGKVHDALEHLHKCMKDVHKTLDAHAGYFHELGYGKANDEMNEEDPDEGSAYDDESEEEEGEREDEQEREARDRRHSDKRGRDNRRARDADSRMRQRDSAHLEMIYQETVAMAEILVPGGRAPTFDARTTAARTLDSICAFRKRTLESYASSEDGRAVMADLTDSKSFRFRDCSCREATVLFKAAVHTQRALNNGGRVSATDTELLAKGGGKPTSNLTPAALNQLYAKMYDAAEAAFVPA